MNESDNNFSIEGTPGESDKSMQLVLASDYAVVREKYIEVIEHTKNMNTPARRLYEKLGFKYRGKQNLFAEVSLSE